MARYSLLALLVWGCVARLVPAQPLNFTAEAFMPGLLEADQRVEDTYNGFVFDFAHATVRSAARHRQAAPVPSM